MDTGSRYKKYVLVIVVVAIISALACMAATDALWGLLISLGVIPVACLFACGAIAIFEVCAQPRANVVAEKGTESLLAEETVEVLEKR